MEHFVLLDRDGRVLWHDRNCEYLRQHCATGQRLWDQAGDPDDAEQIRQALGRLLLTGEPQQAAGTAAPVGQWTARYELVGGLILATWRHFCPVYLTPRERDVLDGICDGLSPATIATMLGVSVSTVETYRSLLRRKTGCDSTAALLRWSIRYGYAQL